MSLPPKPPPRTYARARPAVSDEVNASLQPSGSAWPSRITNTIPSPAVDVAEEHASDREPNDASSGFQFAWKAKMKEIDEMSDDDDGDLPVPGVQDASHRSASQSASGSLSRPQSPQVDQDVFLSTLTASEVVGGTESPSRPASPPITTRRRAKQRAVVSSDEDSENDTKKSPQFPHPIASPKTRSSPTPPTSDEEEMPAHIPHSPRSKGKRRPPPSSRPQVPPLQFDEQPTSGHRKRPSDGVPTRSKLKAPTKKDKRETVMDRGRIAAGHKVAVQPADHSGFLSLQNFFHGIKATASLARSATLDDPIASFSSSPGDPRAASVSMDVVDDPLPDANIAPKVQLRALEDSDDETLPEVGALLDVVRRDKTQAEKQRELMAKKLKYAGHTRPEVDDSEEDDELVIASGKTKDIAPEQASGSKPSEARKRQLALAGVTRAQQRMKQNASPLKSLTSGKRVTQDQLLKGMAQLVRQQNIAATKTKEDKWVERGGQVVPVAGNAEESVLLSRDALQGYAEQGRQNAEAREARMNIDEEDDDMSDADWTEEQEPGSTQVQEASDADTEDADITMVNEEEDDGEDEENEAPGYAKSRGPRRTRAVIDSDSENDENAPPVARTASGILRQSILQEDSDENAVSPIDLVGAAGHRGSASSMDERTEDEGDKENHTHLMYDRSEDKENKAVPRHPFATRPALQSHGSLYGLEDGMQRSLSMSPGDREPPSDEENDENNTSGDKRRPLQNLLADEDPFVDAPRPTSPVVDFTARLLQTSPLSRQTPEPTLQASFDLERFRTKAASSQFSDDEPVALKAAPLQPGFSELFESGTEQPQKVLKRPLGLAPSFSIETEANFGALRKNASLHLTQDLQPAFEAGDSVKRQEAVIFEKEQGYLWETKNRKPETKTPELYVNENGFLTQTRPEGDEAEVYHPSSPAQSENFLGTQRGGDSSLRRPLRTLSLTEPDAAARSPSPLRRLKRQRTPSPDSARSSPSLSPARRSTKNAFDMLRRESLSMRAPRPKKPLLDKSEFVAEEAQESDDDEMVAFGGKKRVGGDDEEDGDGEDLDRTLTSLVDDKDMDEETVAADRVLEKFQEHAHEDDLANEKLQQLVVQGELRKKRRNHRGLGLDDSDDDEEEDERARKMRRGLNEPRIGSDITKLANDPKTSGFLEVYLNDLASDDAEFDYLNGSQVESGQDVEMASGDEGGRKMITASELTEKLREAARQEHESDQDEFDANDVTWLGDGDSDGEQTKVKAVSRQREARNTGTEREHERLQSWAKTEGRSRNLGTGRASGRNAVTNQVKAKTGGGSLRPGPQVKPSDPRRGLAAKPSLLTKVAAERSTRFV
ncbi:hypothetical protein C8R46DRAFT_1073767 [Mycena filopes]|nr:hypothetical protein C8R46DRAFT_1073767 [Mycena filopes]